MSERLRIIDHIKRLAAGNQGRALGWQAFHSRTGVAKSDWYPHIWLRWGDALREAGLAPNRLQTRFGDEFVIEKYIALARELGHLPVEGELRRKSRSDRSFPNHTAFARFGGKRGLIDRLYQYSYGKAGLEDVLALCGPRPDRQEPDPARKVQVPIGYVYLMKSGRHYKIGKTNSIGRRGRELAIQLPVPPRTIHSIATDDPAGVEAYWHRRFDEKRGEGEWFNLAPADVQAFKRWQRIV